jgi:hypothetical protein
MKGKMKAAWEWLKGLFQKSPNSDWQGRMTAEARLYSSKRSADADLERVKAEQKQKTLDCWEQFWFNLRDMYVEMKQKLSAFRVEETEAKVKLQQAKTQKWQQMPAVINAIAKAVRVQVRLTMRALSRFFQRRFNKDHRLATLTTLAVLLVLFGFVLAIPRVWQLGLIVLVVLAAVWAYPRYKKQVLGFLKSHWPSMGKSQKKIPGWLSAIPTFGVLAIFVYVVYNGDVRWAAITPLFLLWTAFGCKLIDQKGAWKWLRMNLLLALTVFWAGVWTIYFGGNS